MNEYSDKVALITGSRRGIGRIIAEHLLDRGARVFGFARGEASFAHTSYTHLQVDISNSVSVTATFARLKRQTDALHVVVNSAGVLTSQYAMILPAGSAQAMLNTNLLGSFLVARESAKMMRKQRWGRIVNISSMAVVLEPIGDSIYAASKAGLEAMTNVLAKELGPLGITCNSIAVTAIPTEMLSQLPKEKVDAIIAALPVPRYAEPDDICNVIDFYLSERSDYVTAQTIGLGGVHR